MSYGNNRGGGYGGGGNRGYGGGGGRSGGSWGGRSQGGDKPQRKDNTGSMRPNDKKTSPNSPDLKGSVMVAGRLYFISGWDNDGYIKLAVTAADEVNESRPTQAPSRGEAPRRADPALDDDVPF